MKGIWDRRLVAMALAAALAGGCAYITKAERETPAPAPPVLIEGRDAEFTQTCTDVFVTELDRPREQPWGPGDTGLESCLGLARSGYSKEMLVEWARSGPEYPLVLERRDAAAREAEEQRKREEEERERNRPRLRGRLRAEGQRLVDAGGQPFVVPFASSLTLLTKTPAERAAVLDQLADLGFQGVRVFGGRLSWAPQSPDQALAALPAVLQETAARGLYLLLPILTDTRDGGYDIEAHVRLVAALTAGHEHAVVEIANEPFHGSQDPRVNDLAGLCEMARRVMAGYPNLWALGAGPADRPIGGRYAGACGPISVSHLERGGSSADMLDRVVGIAQISSVTGRPTISSEPIGAAEVSRPGARLADPAFFGELAHRQASLGISGVFHSEAGLYAQPLGPVQLEAAKAFVAGYRKAPANIPVPPPAGCTGDGLDIVRCQRAAWGRIPHEQIETFLRDVVRDLNAAGVPGGPFGLLVKTDGNSCSGYSCDVLCSGNGPDQRQWDVLGDVEGAQAPAFGELTRDRMTVRVCELEPADRLEAGPPWPEGSVGSMPLPKIVGMAGKGGRR